MPRSTARQRLLNFLGRRGVATAAEIGSALNMSAATVRHHLSILTADGRVSCLGAEATRKPGRPEKSYKLSDRMRGENLGLLADILLNRALSGLPRTGNDAAVRKLAEEVRLRIGMPKGDLALPKRLVDFTEGLNSMHYHARWEAGAHGPRIIFGHCPYGEIIATHPELCMMDAMLLSSEMSAQVEQLSKIGSSAGDDIQCVFALQPRKDSSDGSAPLRRSDTRARLLHGHRASPDA